MILDLHIAVKPLSANKMSGRNKSYQTPEYKAYQQEIRDELEGIEWPFKDNPVSFHVEAGFSARQADLDNIIKPLLDTFQRIYDEFNDNKVYYVELNKKIVAKGEEYLWVRIKFAKSDMFEPNKKVDSSEVITQRYRKVPERTSNEDQL